MQATETSFANRSTCPHVVNRGRETTALRITCSPFPTAPHSGRPVLLGVIPIEGLAVIATPDIRIFNSVGSG